MKRRFATLAALTALLVGLGIGLDGAASSAATPGTQVDIVKVSGLIDPINADLISRSIASAGQQHALLLVLQINSTGGTISATRAAALASAVQHSPVPVVAWVGGSSHPRAYGAAWTLMRSASYTGEGPGSRVGKGPPPPGAAPDGLERSTLSGDDAADKGFINDGAPTIVGFLGDLSGKTLAGSRVDLGVTGGHSGFRKDIQFAFSQLSIVPKLMHTAASPNVAFTMFVIALVLVLFEFFTAGIGVAAGTGILFGILAAYGLGILPTRPYAVILIALSIVAFGIDIQAGAPRFWTGVASLLYLVGAFELYQGQSVSLWVIAVVGVLLLLGMVSGMPSMVRSRFSTPTIGRQSMVGTMGVALSGVAPEGTVEINGAPWRARTNRATPIEVGGSIRVVAIDGLLLEVEPEVGGAKDAHH